MAKGGKASFLKTILLSSFHTFYLVIDKQIVRKGRKTIHFPTPLLLNGYNLTKTEIEMSYCSNIQKRRKNNIPSSHFTSCLFSEIHINIISSYY